MKIVFHTILREKFGVKEFNIDAKTVSEAMNLAGRQLGHEFKSLLYENEKIRPYFTLLLNGRVLDKEKLNEIQVNENDELNIFPPIAGG